MRLPPLVGVPLTALAPWGYGAGSWDTGGACASESRPPASSGRAPPFAADVCLNTKIIVWEGDAAFLEVDALIAPTAAGYQVGASTIFAKVLSYGGRELKVELKHLEPCRSGEAHICKAFNLPCRHLLLTVGPKYKEKYHVAAENTLNACYRECMQLAAESEIRTVAVPATWYDKGYPPQEQAHVALRTLRRCLEKLRASIDTVVIAAANSQDADLYQDLLPLYFPRSDDEAERGASVLPDSCWNSWGEVSIEERKIRISNLAVSADDSDDGGSCLTAKPTLSPENEQDRSFFDARDDADNTALRRLEGLLTEAEDEATARAVCYRYMRRAREVDNLPQHLRYVYRAGKDRYDRHVVVLLGARLPQLGTQDERMMPMFVKELESLRAERFILIYVNTSVSALDMSKLEVLQEMLAMMGARYRQSIDQVLILHPGLAFRAAFALGRAMSNYAADVWHDSVYVEDLGELSRFVPIDQLQLPSYVITA
eukprot:NODE_2088_length_2295_cov_6.812731.p1 GENE.NODE_2088_length_2295_cov_6.812731~~NODE_2088_length_2295_cov_6.812731.p1  ORF type:complete len:485 (+),score=128.63 NODE_2088_length_2295_cov_6.812731:406-1860(+)